MTIITQQIDGLAAGKTEETRPNARDEGHSQIHATSVFAQYHEGENITRSKNSDDKIVVGYNWQGLPFKIVVDGFFGGETQQIFRFIDHHVIRLMDNYATQLSKANSEEETQRIIQQLIATIYELRKQHAKYAEFTMSIAITYEKEGAQYCAGFGMGDTGLVLHRAQAPYEVIQLANNTFQASGKDGFDIFTTNALERGQLSLETLTARNSTFNVIVNPGDEIIGYTHLCNLEKREHEDERNVSQLKTDEFDLTKNLFLQIVEKNKVNFEARCQKLQDEKGSGKVGDDCMIGAVTIPSPELQYQLAHPEAFHMHNMDRQDAMGYDWQFRISVAPFPSNLEKAYHALLPILGETATFKCLTLDSESILFLPLYWDGVLSDVEGATDRDQRGKEICVYMHSLAEGQFEKSPEAWKDMMLRCWKALQDAGVEGIGYYHTYGEHIVSTSSGIRAPFTYTASKDYTDRHGLLHKENPNEQNHPDPLSGVLITRDDLQRHGIDIEEVKHSRLESLEEMAKHLQKAEKYLSGLVYLLSADGGGSQSISSINESLTQIYEQITLQNANELLRQNTALFEQAQRLWPHRADSTLSSHPYFEVIKKITQEDINTQEKLDETKTCLLELTTFSAEEKRLIAADVQQLNMLLQNPSIFTIKPIDPALIETKAFDIQKLYRKLIHFHHEKTLFLEEVKQFICDTAMALTHQLRTRQTNKEDCFNALTRSLIYFTQMTKLSTQDKQSICDILTLERAPFLYKPVSGGGLFSKKCYRLSDEANVILQGVCRNSFIDEAVEEVSASREMR